MLFEIKRFEYGDSWTIGRLYIDGVYLCYTLEDKVRDGEKVPGKTAIPAGTYTVVVDMSSRFGKEMPHILDVPNFSGVRIHCGNTSEDTEGCILLGMQWPGGDSIQQSKVAYNKFFPLLDKEKIATLVIH